MTSLSLLRSVSAALVLCALLSAQKPPPPAVEEKLPLAPPAQPIPFSHKTHVALGVKCTDCHAIPEPGYEAGIPKEVVCMGCHVTIKKDSPPIRKLAEFAKMAKVRGGG